MKPDVMSILIEDGFKVRDCDDLNELVLCILHTRLNQEHAIPTPVLIKRECVFHYQSRVGDIGCNNTIACRFLPMFNELSVVTL
jgi:hypothetical protein